jgi:hypothetical protein
MEDQIKIFGIQNMMLEADLLKLEKSGLEIGHAESVKRTEIVDTDRFDSDIKKEARRMADFYALYYSFENTVRRMIKQQLAEKYGVDWWEQCVPQNIKLEVKKKQDDEKETPMTVRSEDLLAYTNFGDLINIINKNWDDFSNIIRSSKAMQTTLSQLSLIRNAIAHSSFLNDDEIQRLELYMKDWFRIQL